MLEFDVPEEAIRTLLRQTFDNDELVIELVAQLPLTEAQLQLCQQLGEDPEAFRAERDQRFAAAVRFTGVTPFRCLQMALAGRPDPTLEASAGEQLLALTGQRCGSEALLVVIGWQMSAERVERLQALVDAREALGVAN